MYCLQNYIVQFVLEHGKPQDRSRLIQSLRGQLLKMSRDKYASNVCEKALQIADVEDRQDLIEEILAQKPNGDNTTSSMIYDQYASMLSI